MSEMNETNEIKETSKQEDMPKRDRLVLLLSLIFLFLVAGFTIVIMLLLKMR